MTQDVRQWLAEIKTLQQKLDDAYRERDEAYGSAANWRSLYETEAQQRRNDAAVAEQRIQALITELARLQSATLPSATNGDAPEKLQQQVAGLSIEELRATLVETLVECDRLSEALTAEQEDHAQTRQELTAALGDTIEQLSRARTPKAPETAIVRPEDVGDDT
jgi:methionine synthase I (cobalamin-dependent)